MKSLLILSEIANAHEGNVLKAEEMIIASAQAGVDAVKMQKHTADELLVKSHSKYERFRFLEMKDHEWVHVNQVAKKQGIKFICDVFGEDSLDFVLEKLSCDGIKVHSSDLGNIFLLRKLRAWGGPIYLSAGGATSAEIVAALDSLNPVKKNIVLMHGFQNFPTSLDETNLNRLNTLKAYGVPVGYMDHIDAQDPMAMILPLLAVAAGAVVIEKHITLDRSLKGADYYSSFEPKEMKELVRLLRQAARAMGKHEIEFGPEELEYRKKFKKHIVASKAMHSGHTITEADLMYRRVETDKDLCSMAALLGKRVKQPIQEQDLIDPGLVH